MAHLHFDNCHVPANHLTGEEGAGFKERQTFGTALSERQVIRHELVDILRRVEIARARVYDLAWRVQKQAAAPAGVSSELGASAASGATGVAALVDRICLAKVEATQAMPFCADAAVQFLGGLGYMRGTKKGARVHREVKVMMIGGGSGSEGIRKDLAARQLGL